MSAPTTAEVRERLATAGLVVARASGDEREREAVTMAVGGGCLALKTYALPIAEHRDALAAEVARLREALAASEARAAKVCEAVERVVPYVTATIGPGGRMGGGEWVNVHHGRADSSVRQLEALLATAKGAER